MIVHIVCFCHSLLAVDWNPLLLTYLFSIFSIIIMQTGYSLKSDDNLDAPHHSAMLLNTTCLDKKI